MDHTFSVETNMMGIVFKRDILIHNFVCCCNFFPSHSALSLFSVVCKTAWLIACTDYFNSSSSSKTEQPDKMKSITISTPSLMHEEQILCTTFFSPPSSSAIKMVPYQKLNTVQSLGRESDDQQACNEHIWVLHWYMVEGRPLVA